MVVQAMQDQENLILPLRNGIDIPSKPPLLHWLSYFSERMLGASESALRFPSALASSLALAFFFYVFSLRRGRESGIFGILVLASTLSWANSSIVTRVDMMFSLWVSVATWLLFEWSEKKDKGRLPLLLLASLALALATLTKGPAGIALPGAVLAAYFLCTRPLKELPVFSGLAVLAISLTLSGLWYYAAYLQGGQRFLDVQLMRENVARVVGMKQYATGHEGGPLVILPLLVTGFLPWSLFFPLYVRELWQKRKQIFSNADRAAPFCIVWVLVYLIFFAFTSSKRGVYLLPSYPAIAYLFLSVLDLDLLKHPRTFRFVKILETGFLVLLVIALFILLDLRTFDERPLLRSLHITPHDVETIFGLTSMSLISLLGISSGLILFAIGLLRLFGGEIRRAIGIQAIGILVLISAANAGVLSVVAEQQSPKHHLSDFLAALPEGHAVSQFRQDYYALNFYLHRRVPLVFTRDELTKTGSSFIFVSDNELQDAIDTLGPCSELVRSSDFIANGKHLLVLLECS